MFKIKKNCMETKKKSGCENLLSAGKRKRKKKKFKFLNNKKKNMYSTLLDHLQDSKEQVNYYFMFWLNLLSNVDVRFQN